MSLQSLNVPLECKETFYQTHKGLLPMSNVTVFGKSLMKKCFALLTVELSSGLYANAKIVLSTGLNILTLHAYHFKHYGIKRQEPVVRRNQLRSFFQLE